MPEHTYTWIDLDEYGKNQIANCDDCGAYAPTIKEIEHHKTCIPGECKKWEEFYDKEENNGLYDQSSETNCLY